MKWWWMSLEEGGNVIKFIHNAHFTDENANKKNIHKKSSARAIYVHDHNVKCRTRIWSEKP